MSASRGKGEHEREGQYESAKKHAPYRKEAPYRGHGADASTGRLLLVGDALAQSLGPRKIHVIEHAPRPFCTETTTRINYTQRGGGEEEWKKANVHTAPQGHANGIVQGEIGAQEGNGNEHGPPGETRARKVPQGRGVVHRAGVEQKGHHTGEHHANRELDTRQHRVRSGASSLVVLAGPPCGCRSFPRRKGSPSANHMTDLHKHSPIAASV